MLSTAKDWEPVLHAHGLDTVAAVYALATGTVFTKTGTTEVRRVELGDRAVFIKKYWVTNPNQIISGITRGVIFGKSKVRREFDNLRWLRANGFNAPGPVAFGEERRAGILLRSCLISEAVDGRSVDQNVDLMKLADAVRRLHDREFFHRDLFWRNILVDGDRFYFIDAHKGGYRRGTQADDLATLDAPAPWFFRRTQRLRFFLRYLNHPKLTAADKQLARRALTLAAPLRDKQLARVRA